MKRPVLTALITGGERRNERARWSIGFKKWRGDPPGRYGRMGITLLGAYQCCVFGFLSTPDSAEFNGTARQPSLRMVLGMHHPAAGPTGRCPVQPNTPLGPDQVHVIIIIIEDDCTTTSQVKCAPGPAGAVGGVSQSCWNALGLMGVIVLSWNGVPTKEIIYRKGMIRMDWRKHVSWVCNDTSSRKFAMRLI
jgi:hypothetical protein